MWTRLSISYTILWIISSKNYVESTCTQPSSAWSGNWWDSQFDGTFAIAFSSNVITVTGWSVTAYASTVTSWSCVSEDTSNNYIVFKGDQSVDLFGAPQNAYLCMAWTSVTDNSFVYYLRANQEVNAGDFRVYIEDAAITMGAASKYCSPSSGPSTPEYHVLVKQGTETTIPQFFPTILLGTYEYNATDGSSSYCGTGSVWDNCANRTTTAFNYTQCSTVMAFSSGGVLYGVYSTTSGSNTYVSLVNADSTTDQSTTYRFTCLIAKYSGSNVQLSIGHGSCDASGSPTTVPTGGMTALLTPYAFITTTTTTTKVTTTINLATTIQLTEITTTPFTSSTTTTTTTTDDSSSSNAGLFAGAAIGGLLLILIIVGIIIIILKLKKKKKQRVQQEAEKKPMPPQGKYLPPINGDTALARPARQPSDCVIETMSPRDALEINPPETDNRLTPLPNHPVVQEKPSDKHPLPPITTNG